jgi:hypothetical protein
MGGDTDRLQEGYSINSEIQEWENSGILRFRGAFIGFVGLEKSTKKCAFKAQNCRLKGS